MFKLTFSVEDSPLCVQKINTTVQRVVWAFRGAQVWGSV